MRPRLGVNINSIAVLKQGRATPYPDLLEATRLIEQAGADQLTVHLSENRNKNPEHSIGMEDVLALKNSIRIPLHLQISPSPAMAKMAMRIRPAWVCLVPEMREESVFKKGLSITDIKKHLRKITPVVNQLKKASIRVSFLIEPHSQSVQLVRDLGAEAVEFHMGYYVRSKNQSHRELEILKKAAEKARSIGVQAHVGCGLNEKNVRPIAELETVERLPLIEGYQIGHSIVCRAALVGLERAVREMISAIYAP